MTGDTVQAQEGNCRDLVVLRTMCSCASSNQQLGEVEGNLQLQLQLQTPGRIKDDLFLCNFEKTEAVTNQPSREQEDNLQLKRLSTLQSSTSELLFHDHQIETGLLQ